MEEDKLDELQDKIDEVNSKNTPTVYGSNEVSTQRLNDTMNGLFENALSNHKSDIDNLADQAVQKEISIKQNQLKGREKVLNSQTNQAVTDEKIKEDEKKHERSKTILKGFGIITQLPAPYRITALVIGFPFFLLYLCTFGAATLFLTFVAKGFITMVADCCDRFAEVNRKFINNSNNKEFSLGKAIFNSLKWLLIIGVIITIVILLITK